MRAFLALTCACALARAQDYLVTEKGVRLECTILEVRKDRLIVEIKGKKYSVKKSALREWKRARAPEAKAGIERRERVEPPGARTGIKARVGFLVRKLAQPRTDSDPIDHRALTEELASLLRRKDAAKHARHLLRSGPEGARGWIALALAKAGVKGMAPELFEMLRSYAPERVPAPLIEALGYFRGKEVLPALAKVFPALSPPAKAAAATAMGRTKDGRAGAILVRLLEEEDCDVRSSARMALLPIAKQDGKLAEVLLARADDSKHPEEYARLFAELDDPSCLPFLRNMLKHGDNTTRRAAAAAVARYKDPKSIKLLLDIASDEETPGWLRRCCLSSLKRVDDGSAAPKLVELLERSGEDRRVKRAAHRALRGVTGKDLPANPSLWRAAVERPEWAGDEAVAVEEEQEQEPTAEKVVLPAESRPTHPPLREQARRMYPVWILMAAGLVVVIGGHAIYSRLKKPKRPAPRRKKTR